MSHNFAFLFRKNQVEGMRKRFADFALLLLVFTLWLLFRTLFSILLAQLRPGSDAINELNITRIKRQCRKIAPSQTYRLASYMCAHKCFICAEWVETAQYLWGK